MVHKKYTYKDGKRYGPYVYETKRVGDRVVTNYLGPDSSGMKKKVLVLVGIILVIGFVLLLLNLPGSSTGRVSFDLAVTNYKPGQTILGVITLFFKPGEFVPQDTMVRVTQDDQVIEVPLSDLIHSNVQEGNYYAEGVKLTGEGPGYGEKGTIISSPTIDAQMRVYTLSDSSSSSSDSDIELSPEDSTLVASSGMPAGCQSSV